MTTPYLIIANGKVMLRRAHTDEERRIQFGGWHRTGENEKSWREMRREDRWALVGTLFFSSSRGYADNHCLF